MIRCGSSVKKIHEIDIPFAGRFDIPAGIDPVHCSIDRDLEHLTRCGLIFSDPVIGGIQVRKVHSLHKGTYKAYRIV